MPDSLISSQAIQPRQITNSSSKSLEDLRQNCLLDMSKNHLPFAGDFKTDTPKVQRYSKESNNKDKAEWYIAFTGVSRNRPFLNCVYGSWKTGEKFYYSSWSDDPSIGPEVLEELRKLAGEARKKSEEMLKGLHEDAAKECKKIWDKASPTPLNPGHIKYLELKHIEAEGVKFGKNPYDCDSVIIPIRNIHGDIRSLQYISVNGQGEVFKAFHTGGEISGNFQNIGNLIDGEDINVVEGYATGGSCYKAKNESVVVAFNSSNLPSVVKALCLKYPNSRITILADDDVETKEKTGKNTGRAAAEKASRDYGCDYLCPKFPYDFRLPNKKKPTDFNDLHVHFGMEHVKNQIDEFKKHDSINKHSSKLKFVSVHSLIDQPFVPNCLIKNFIDAESLTLLIGESGCGKSFFAVAISAALAASLSSFYDLPIRKSGPVFYICGEGHYGIKKRFKAWSIANKTSFENVPLFVSDRPAQFLNHSSVNDLVKAVEELQNDHGDPVLVVIDTLNRNFGDGDENSTEDMTKFCSAVDLQIRTKFLCSVLIVHHTGLSEGKRARGSSSLKATVDFEYLLQKTKQSITLSAVKVKDGNDDLKMNFSLDVVDLGWVDPEDGTPITSCVLMKKDPSLSDIKPASSLSKDAGLAFDILNELSSDSSVTNGGIHENICRSRFFEHDLVKEKKTDAKRQSFKRAKDELVNKLLVKIEGKFWTLNESMTERDRA